MVFSEYQNPKKCLKPSLWSKKPPPPKFCGYRGITSWKNCCNWCRHGNGINNLKKYSKSFIITLLFACFKSFLSNCLNKYNYTWCTLCFSKSRNCPEYPLKALRNLIWLLMFLVLSLCPNDLEKTWPHRHWHPECLIYCTIPSLRTDAGLFVPEKNVCYCFLFVSSKVWQFEKKHKQMAARCVSLFLESFWRLYQRGRPPQPANGII